MDTQTKSLTDYADKIKAQKEKEKDEATAKLAKYQKKIQELEAESGRLEGILFDINKLTVENIQQTIEQLKALSKRRVKLYMLLYKWQNKFNQLKYI